MKKKKQRMIKSVLNLFWYPKGRRKKEMDFERFVERFKERITVTLNRQYGPTSLEDIKTDGYCYYMKADREIGIFDVIFNLFLRPETGEVKVISLALGQFVEFALEAVFTEDAVLKQVDDYIYSSMIIMSGEEGSSFLTGERVQNTTHLMDGKYADLMVPPNERWNPKTKALERINQ
jgi:hypothetical protein